MKHKLIQFIRLRNIGLIIADWLRRMPAERYLHWMTLYRKAGISILIIAAMTSGDAAYCRPTTALRPRAMAEKGPVSAAEIEGYDSRYDEYAAKAGAVYYTENMCQEAAGYLLRIQAEKKKTRHICVAAVDGNSGAFKTSTAYDIARLLRQDGVNAVVISRDWFIYGRPARYARQDAELTAGTQSLKDDEISLRREKFEKEVLEKLGQFQDSGEEQMILDLGELYNKYGGGELNRHERIVIDRNTVVIIEGNYLLKKEWRRYFDAGILMLAKPSISITRRVDRDTAHADESRVERVFWRINTPSYLHYLENEVSGSDMTVITDKAAERAAMPSASKPIAEFLNRNPRRAAEILRQVLEIFRESHKNFIFHYNCRLDQFVVDTADAERPVVRFIQQDYDQNCYVDPRGWREGDYIHRDRVFSEVSQMLKITNKILEISKGFFTRKDEYEIRGRIRELVDSLSMLDRQEIGRVYNEDILSFVNELFLDHWIAVSEQSVLRPLAAQARGMSRVPRGRIPREQAPRGEGRPSLGYNVRSRGSLASVPSSRSASTSARGGIGPGDKLRPQAAGEREPKMATRETLKKLAAEPALQNACEAAVHFLNRKVKGVEFVLKRLFGKNGRPLEEFIGELVEAKAVEDNVRYARVVELSAKHFGTEIDFILEVDRAKYGDKIEGSYELEDGIYLGESKTEDRSQDLDLTIEAVKNDKIKKYLLSALRMKKEGYPVKGIIFAIGGDVIPFYGIRDFEWIEEKAELELSISNLRLFLALVPDEIMVRVNGGLLEGESGFVEGLTSDLESAGKIDPLNSAEFRKILADAVVAVGIQTVRLEIMDALKKVGANPTSRRMQTKAHWAAVFNALRQIAEKTEKAAPISAKVLQRNGAQKDLFSCILRPRAAGERSAVVNISPAEKDVDTFFRQGYYIDFEPIERARLEKIYVVVKNSEKGRFQNEGDEGGFTINVREDGSLNLTGIFPNLPSKMRPGRTFIALALLMHYGHEEGGRKFYISSTSESIKQSLSHLSAFDIQYRRIVSMRDREGKPYTYAYDIDGIIPYVDSITLDRWNGLNKRNRRGLLAGPAETRRMGDEIFGRARARRDISSSVLRPRPTGEKLPRLWRGETD